MEVERKESEIFDLVVEVIKERKAGRGATNADGKSYVKSLMDKGVDRICEKIAEETMEYCVALKHEDDTRVANEAADLMFHILVGLVSRDLDLGHVASVLRDRLGVSGIDEKLSRRN